MTINCLTLFPQLFEVFAAESILGRAVRAGAIRIHCIDFRAFTSDRHGRADDYPYGGAPGMLLSAQPLFACFDALSVHALGARTRNVFMSPAGRVLTAETAQRLGRQYDVINILCGHYEGVDERVLEACIEEEISIGDYVVTGGELPAMVLMDAVARFVPGVLGNHESAADDSFQHGLLEPPQYTRPAVFRGRAVPEVLLSGNHAAIEAWRREQALLRTKERRPDLLSSTQYEDTGGRAPLEGEEE